VARLSGTKLRVSDRMRLTHNSLAASTRWSIALVSVSLACALGCGDGKVKRNPVNGSVNVDGKPAGGVMLLFVPVDGTPEFQRLRPMGITGPDGKFSLNTFGNGDGVPAGQFKVLITWPGKSNGPSRDGPGQMGPDQFKGRYNNLEKTEFNVDVKPGGIDLPPYELKSR
jgi:hypothetical protein